ncbi:MAG TPA: hypothetical protein VFA27_11690 [Vicinamibacterales bacterium]|nr:hypothetical protein [Vicinamibacterales bacterium]
MTSWFIAVTVAAAIAPTGHWEGTLDTPQASMAFQIDLAQVDGTLTGAISIPAQKVRGLPLTTVVVDGRSITFGARSDQLLAATLADDSKTLEGTFSMGTFSFPFTLTRTGEASIAPRPTSAAVGADLEGTWHATAADGGADVHVDLTVTNRPDGTAIATIVNLDEGGLQLPVVISRDASAVTIESHVVESSFSGRLTANGEIVGTFRQDAAEVPLTFRR